MYIIKLTNKINNIITLSILNIMLLGAFYYFKSFSVVILIFLASPSTKNISLLGR